MATNNHAFSFPEGEKLSKMGASWFASYWHYDHCNKNELSWKNCESVSRRISYYNKTKQYHDDWRREIMKMDDSNLETNEIGLTGTQVKALVSEISITAATSPITFSQVPPLNINFAQNTFTFHGIGQGLFYSGSIANGGFNFVYDCGSEKSTMLRGVALPFNDLGFVAVSHFHDDHVNGLPDLFRNHRVEKVFLPYFDAHTYKDVFIANLVLNGIDPSSAAFALLTRLYQCPVDADLPRWDYDLPEAIFVDEPGHPYTRDLWEFRFYNRRISDCEFQYIQHALNNLLNGQSIESYISNRNNYDDLKAIFRRVFSNENLTSLVLLHWNKANASVKSLLTGDVCFDQNLSNRVVSDLETDDTIYLQIPHHGAKNEWDSVDQRILSRTTAEVISVGRSNRYHHPSICKMSDYISTGAIAKIKLVFERNDFSYNC